MNVINHLSDLSFNNNIISLQGKREIVAEFKLVLVGDGGVGKTTFVKRH